MALKHYQGSIPDARKQSVWVCPTCGAQNTTPIEQGCKGCGTGADAKHVGVPERRSPPPRLAPSIVHLQAYAETWAAGHPEATVAEAFAAGYAYARAGLQADVGATGTLSGEPDAHGLGQVDRDTIAAALRFYAENMLALGAIPGQLTAADARQLADTFDGGLQSDDVPDIPF